MIDRSLRKQVLVFLAIAACFSMSLQTVGHLPCTETTASTLQCVEASLVTASTLPRDTAGEGSGYDGYSSGESLFLVPGLPAIPNRMIYAESLFLGAPLLLCAVLGTRGRRWLLAAAASNRTVKLDSERSWSCASALVGNR